MTNLYSGECEGRYESWKNGESRNASPGILKCKAAEGSDSAGEDGKVEKARLLCEPVLLPGAPSDSVRP